MKVRFHGGNRSVFRWSQILCWCYLTPSTSISLYKTSYCAWILSFNIAHSMRLQGSIAGSLLTHWGRVTHLCASKLTSIGSDNGLSPGRRQAIIWTNAGISLIEPSGTNYSEILIETHTFSFMKISLKKSSGKRWPFCLGLNVLNTILRPSHKYLCKCIW